MVSFRGEYLLDSASHLWIDLNGAYKTRVSSVNWICISVEVFRGAIVDINHGREDILKSWDEQE